MNEDELMVPELDENIPAPVAAVMEHNDPPIIDAAFDTLDIVWSVPPKILEKVAKLLSISFPLPDTNE